MERELFHRFSNDLMHLGADGVAAPQFSLGELGAYVLRYTPFEYVNRGAKLVIVGITPGNTQLALSYGKAQELLRQGYPIDLILREVKKVGAFGGPSMRPNLVKMLRHFHFDQLLGISDVESLWGSDADLLQSTSVVPHAAFKAGKMFAGSFDEVLASPLLSECFRDCFVPSVREIESDTLFVGLGPCPEAALEWCVHHGALQRKQVLGAFCHPSSAGGSTTRYYLREVAKGELDSKNPVLRRTDWLDRAYEQMRAATASLLGHTAANLPVRRDKVSAVPTPNVPSPTHLKPTTTKVGDTATGATDDVAIILAEVQQAGYRLTNQTAKLAEFATPSGQTIYLVKTTSKMNRVNLMVHPGLMPDAVMALPGVASVSHEHRFHSNMSRFPKRLNRGATETAYGWQVSLDTFDDLRRFLAAFADWATQVGGTGER
ncbi:MULTISPECIES: hypothetical protein [Burkholderia cepacia complex]|uniref:Uncharacterized protein n=1 Tax=Burkholderia vietnamiensis TaxID=60552 RepID=A0AA45BDP6_BURVI|nr:MULTISPECIES: hypothetical protein [Burkholderia cepacia complex]KVO53538.1 hypothetical protein WT18_25430 [Burkholderia stagnalis]KVP04078.1 hypothetical protein WT20_28730 [Burkholderia stagnalis]KVS07310.1 hypothetical protein WK32_00095 [Burkholderia vietnamiensis]KVW93083.1 hypothetical protein WT30_21290 [Burkholderia stagnalis]KWH67538.1 hypothetical protein WT66_30950 [Burkholderia stagnalis]